MMELRQVTRNALLGTYTKYGIKALDAKALELIKQCETSGYTARQRATIKGELAEIVVECHLTSFLKQMVNSCILKGLCIVSDNGAFSTEIDIALITPCRIYLFECKSFSGHKVVSDKCFLKGAHTQKDVYGQSVHHMRFLDEQLGSFRVKAREKISPYKLILFEFSSNDCRDTRDTKWKEAIPLLSISNLDDWFQKEFTRYMPVQWDYAHMFPVLQQLDAQSASNFEFHLKRLGGK